MADLSSPSAALWAWRQLRQVRRAIAVGGLDGFEVAPPPRLPDSARSTVELVLTVTGASCLPRSAVLQAWDLAHGRARDLIIGVTSPARGFRAHAWLEGDDGASEFTELSRRPACPAAR